MKVRCVRYDGDELWLLTESAILEASASKQLRFARRCWKRFAIGTVVYDELHGEQYVSPNQPHRISISVEPLRGKAAVVICAL